MLPFPPRYYVFHDSSLASLLLARRDRWLPFPKEHTETACLCVREADRPIGIKWDRETVEVWRVVGGGSTGRPASRYAVAMYQYQSSQVAFPLLCANRGVIRSRQPVGRLPRCSAASLIAQIRLTDASMGGWPVYRFGALDDDGSAKVELNSPEEATSHVCSTVHSCACHASRMSAQQALPPALPPFGESKSAGARLNSLAQLSNVRGVLTEGRGSRESRIEW